MGKVMQKGKEVLIFRYFKEFGPIQNQENYIVGTVQSVKVVTNTSKKGVSSDVCLYEVLGSDGKIYTGTYGFGMLGNSFFRTREDHIEFLKRKIASNQDNIFKLQEKNNQYNDEIKKLEGEMEQELAVHNERLFAVSSEMSEEFKSLEPNTEIREQNEEVVQKLNFDDDVDVLLDRFALRKTRKLIKK